MFLLRYTAIVLFFMQLHPGYSLLIFLGLGALAFGASLFLSTKGARRLGAIFIVLFWVFIANLFFGHFARNALVMAAGEPGEGVVVSVEATSSTYNDQVVMRHELILKPGAKGSKAIETFFETDEFNIVPSPPDGYTYPQTGTKFNLLYLPEYPAALVIVRDDGSQYARSLRCAQSAAEHARSSAKLAADPDNARYKQALDAAKAAYQRDCGGV